MAKGRGSVRRTRRKVAAAREKGALQKAPAKRGRRGGEKRGRCARTAVMKFFLQRRHLNMGGAKHAGRNKENPVGRVQSDGHG